jgi:hypothetical protein
MRRTRYNRIFEASDSTGVEVVGNRGVIAFPYCNAGRFYDTRHGDRARTLLTLGAEVSVSDHFRYEVYLARQADRLPEDQDITALGVVLKWHF